VDGSLFVLKRNSRGAQIGGVGREISGGGSREEKGGDFGATRKEEPRKRRRILAVIKGAGDGCW